MSIVLVDIWFMVGVTAMLTLMLAVVLLYFVAVMLLLVFDR